MVQYKNVHVEVVAKDFDSFDQMVRKFNKKVKKDGLLEVVFERRFYKKPSQKRNEQKRRRRRLNEINKQNT